MLLSSLKRFITVTVLSSLMLIPSVEGAERVITNDDVVAMVRSGLSDSAIITAIARSAKKFDVSPNGLVRLRQAGVSNAVIEAMLGSQPISSLTKKGGESPSDVGLPSAYGYYVVDGGQLQSLQAVPVITRMGLEVGGNLGVGAGADGLDGDPPMFLRSSNPVFIVYQQSINASSFYFSELEFVSTMRAYQFNMHKTKPEFFPNVFGGKKPNDIVPINLWRPKVSGSLRTEPVDAKTGMFRLFPDNQLTPGRYALWIGNALHPVNIVFTTRPNRQTAAFYFGVGQLSTSMPEPRETGERSTGVRTPVTRREDISTLIQDGRREYLANNWRAAEVAYVRVLDQDSENFEATAQLSSIYIRLGDFEKSKLYGQKAMNLRPDHPKPYYNMACTYAKLGDTERAIALLKQAVAKGFKDLEWVRKDPDLESIRYDPRFKSLTER